MLPTSSTALHICIGKKSLDVAFAFPIMHEPSTMQFAVDINFARLCECSVVTHVMKTLKCSVL